MKVSNLPQIFCARFNFEINCKIADTNQLRGISELVYIRKSNKARGEFNRNQ